jgi:hypothetical protein
MKSKIISLLIAITGILSITSCSVTYRERHPRPVQRIYVVPVRISFQPESSDMLLSENFKIKSPLEQPIRN